ncbi:MAG: hypothetical protein JXB10_11660 [Pirellulales bacterium]|nr:hypothetical protein [Pirellulales bacterium]
MLPRHRLLAALQRRQPDRLPVTTHQVMPYYLKKYLGGISANEFYERFQLDPVQWPIRYKPGYPPHDYYDPLQTEGGLLEDRRVVSDEWRIVGETIGDPADRTVRYSIQTPKGYLTLLLQSNDQTSWLLEHPIKEKSDIELLQFMARPHCDVEAVNQVADDHPESLIRGYVCSFDIFGQPGCWQDACCLVGTEKMILSTYDDPAWVRELLALLQGRKLEFISSMAGTRYDLISLGGGDASSTVISPKLFREFVSPFDAPIIAAAHAVGQRVVYHTCGGMMPILEDIVDMGPDAVETLTPPAMGGDMRLAEAKRHIGDRVCMIGGFDQLHYFQKCSPEQTRAEVRRCFEEAGVGGGYILSPSDHFFDAEEDLITAFADEAHQCVYS